MSDRILVACVGNLFFGDDGFGSAVARRLAEEPLPPDVVVTDYGIRGLHLAYEMLEPHALVILVDAVSRGGAPGTLYLLEPDLGAEAPDACADAHGMDLPTVVAAVQSMGGTVPRMLLVGCEPERVDEGIGLSDAVSRAVDGAASMVRELLDRETERRRAARRCSDEVP